jgi:processive 1,2-diacylglycerol beta-glucosyltransferase
VLVTKPGGLTTAEAALSSLPSVFFDAIHGPEQRNAARVTEAGAAIIADSPAAAAEAALNLLRDPRARARMSESARRLSMPNPAAVIALLALKASAPEARDVRKAAARAGAATARMNA